MLYIMMHLEKQCVLSRYDTETFYLGGEEKKTQPKFSCLVTDSSWKERIFNSQRGMAGNLRQSNPLTSKCQASFKLDVPSFRF